VKERKFMLRRKEVNYRLSLKNIRKGKGKAFQRDKIYPSGGRKFQF